MSAHPEGAILVIDDETATVDAIVRTLEAEGFRVCGVSSGEAALARIEQESFDMILCDIRLKGMDGLTLQKRLRTVYPEVPVVMITAYAAVDTAVRALKEGAYDYIPKPFSGEELRGAVRRALESRRLRLENDSLRTVVSNLLNNIWVSKSTPMVRVYDQAAKVAASQAAVFINGETGTGKEILARTIHVNSPRRDKIFCALNCAAFPENLADSQIFGHARGAFTGAIADVRGYLEIANGGTLFLDELADLRPEVQAKLLRFLDDQKFRRIGSEREISVDIRILAAAQKEPEQLVKEGKLREDLFFRLGGISLRLPPLRERSGDIADLALHFLRRYSRDIKKPIEGLTPEAAAALEKYPWPGNVRELKNVMERAAIFAVAGGSVGLAELPEKFRRFPGGSHFAVESADLLPLEDLTNRYIRHVLEVCGGNNAKAARALGVAPSTLWRHLGQDASGKSDPV